MKPLQNINFLDNNFQSCDPYKETTVCHMKIRILLNGGHCARYICIHLHMHLYDQSLIKRDHDKQTALWNGGGGSG